MNKEVKSFYFNQGEKKTYEAQSDNLYFYKAFIGHHSVEISLGDCAYWIDKSNELVHLTRGPCTIDSAHMAVVVRGYMPENKTSSVITTTTLPYINGCSTKQIFPPDRVGDPTFQMLHMPPHTSEQAHHIHSTVRVVYVLSGEGYSLVGMDPKNLKETKLTPGMVCILEPMCPHHFRTENNSLRVLPLHVFSSVSSLEYNHPMFNGTHTV
ncbi:MAG: cupin domain-containing protein [Bdellovibrionaceae bacterium]|nr:cupin domain-containing protein [Pseudobdellovibrionaceae bacterium]